MLPSLYSSSVYVLIIYFTCLSDAACFIIESANQMIELAFNFQVSRVNRKLCKIPEYPTYLRLLVNLNIFKSTRARITNENYFLKV